MVARGGVGSIYCQNRLLLGYNIGPEFPAVTYTVTRLLHVVTCDDISKDPRCDIDESLLLTSKVVSTYAMVSGLWVARL